MSFLSWVIPLLLIWPLFWCVRVLLIFRVLSGLRLGRDVIEPITPEQIPAHLREALESWRRDLEVLGFSFRQGWIVRSPFDPELSITQVEFVDTERVVRAIFQPMPTAARSGELYFRLCSTLADGREVVTSCYEAEQILPGNSPVLAVTMPEAPLGRVYAEHLNRIRQLATMAVPLLDLQEAAARQHGQNLIDVTLGSATASGALTSNRDGSYYWKPLPGLKKAVEVLRTHQRTTRAHKSAGRNQKVVTLSEESRTDFEWDYYAQARAIKRAQFNGKIKAVIAIVSLILFSVALAWGTSLEIGLAVVVALVIHEAGHLWAMRWFGHRDTQLIFIPFFGGAAVASDDIILKPWQRIVVLLMGPLPGLIGGLALFIFSMMSSNAQWMLPAIIIMILNLFNMLPILPLDGGQIFDVAVGSRFPRARLFFFGASAVALLAFGWLGDGGTMLLVLGVFMLVRIPVEKRLAELEVEVRDEMPANDEETVVRRLLTRLRDPIWAKTALPQKLVLAKILQAKIRQPVPRWGTAIFALVAYTCPVWLILPGVFLGLMVSATRDITMADARADEAGIVDRAVETSPEIIADSDNAAPLLKEVEDSMAQAQEERGKSLQNGSEIVDRSASWIAPLRAASQRHHFAPAELETGATRRAHCDAVMVLADAAEQALAQGDADTAVALAEDGLILTRLLQQRADAWRWNAHAFASARLWSVMEKAMASAEKLPAPRLERLARLADDEADFRFAQQGMAEDMLSSYRDAQDLFARHVSKKQSATQKLFSAIGGISTTQTYGDFVDQAIVLKRDLKTVREGHWKTDTAKAITMSTSQRALELLAAHLAHLRLVRAGLAIQWQVATTGRTPKSFQEVSSPWWHGTPRHPASGETLQWNASSDAVVLSFASNKAAPIPDMPVNEAQEAEWEESEDRLEGSGLSWRIPLPAKT